VASGFSRTLLVAFLLAPTLAFGQALTNPNSLRVGYNSRKATVNPQGELKVQIDAVDKAIADAMRLGQMGEVRRQIAKGMTLLNGGTWTPALDFQSSLVLRSDRTVIDSSAPYALRLEQIYLPAIELTPALTAKASLRPRPVARPGTVTPPVVVPGRELATFDAVARDLRESPLAMELDLSAADDGAYLVDVAVFDGATALGTASLGVVLQKGLDARVKALEAAAPTMAEGLRADVLYPADYIRNVNRGRVGLGTFDVAAELKAAETMLAAARAGTDPFKGRTGDMERHYVLQGANEVMPYRVYVPKAYKGEAMPLVIALHGLGANEDSFFDSYGRVPPQLAEKHGFLMAAPLGYRVDGFYGSGLMGAADAASKRRIELSEKDVLEVLRLMRAHYKVDESRIYLMGHSMGAIGTWHLGAKYADTWAGMAAFAGVGSPATAERMKGIPQFVVHGDADPTVNVSGSRNMVAAMNKLGMAVTYIEVPGGGHSDVVVPNLPKAFEFLAAQRKAAVATQQ
jgi:predicted esterase